MPSGGQIHQHVKIKKVNHDLNPLILITVNVSFFCYVEVLDAILSFIQCWSYQKDQNGTVCNQLTDVGRGRAGGCGVCE